MKKAIALGIVLASLVSLPCAASAGDFCASPTHSVVSLSNVSATAVPSSALAGRATIRVTVSLETVGTPLVKCRQDGSNPTMGTGNVGDVLAKGDTVTYRVGSGTSVKCISDTNGAVVHVLECK